MYYTKQCTPDINSDKKFKKAVATKQNDLMRITQFYNNYMHAMRVAIRSSHHDH